MSLNIYQLDLGMKQLVDVNKIMRMIFQMIFLLYSDVCATDSRTGGP